MRWFDNTNNLDHDQTEEEARTCEVSDDALEAASGASAPGICRGLQRKVAAWRPFPLRLPKLAASSFQTKRAVAYWPLSTFAVAQQFVCNCNPDSSERSKRQPTADE